MAGLPQYTAPSPSTCYPSPKYSDPPSPVTKSTQKPPKRPKPARYLLLDNEYDLFSPQNWAKDGFELYPDEVDATMAELRKIQSSVPRFSACNISLNLCHHGHASINFWREPNSTIQKKKRWREIPGVCMDMCQLIRPMRVLIDAIMEHFGYATTRPVVDSFRIPADCLEFDQLHRKPDCVYLTTPLKRIPHMMALGVSGSNFGPLPSVFESGPSYAACISPVELKIDEECDYTSDLIQLAVYARQCFMRQHNRRCVYGLLITESTVTLYMFDRSGVCRSCPIDIHKRAADFVRLLLGVWSPDDAVVGFDTTISWDQDERGLWRRHIAGRNEDDEPCRYPLAEPAPVCERWSIDGRGTVCWAATDADGEHVLIKDQWRDPAKWPEWEFLHLLHPAP
ncbi:hypothetical protein BJ912DRAFT_1053694 [Pholiota molesta]|nr:hypothetical protein BJ912DRAFT_1053694 [Pholiota molesta]